MVVRIVKLREEELSRRLSGFQTQCATAEFAVGQHWWE